MIAMNRVTNSTSDTYLKHTKNRGKIHPVVLELPDRIELPSDEYKSTVISHYTKEANKTTNIVRPSYYIYIYIK